MIKAKKISQHELIGDIDTKFLMLLPVAVRAHLFENGFDTSLSISKFFSIGEVKEVKCLVNGDRWLLKFLVHKMSWLHSHILSGVNLLALKQLLPNLILG